MALPKIDVPLYTLYLHSLNAEIKFRPFLVKEEKLLLIALESNDYKSIMDSIKQVIQNCIASEGVSVENLPLFEVEQLFLHLRARSIGEVVSIKYICENVVDDSPCKTDMQLDVDLLKVVLEQKAPKTEFMLTDTVGIKLKFPTIEASNIMNSGLSQTEMAIKLIELSTEYLYDVEQVYQVNQMQENEFTEFIENLTQEQFQKLQNFFNEFPKLKYSSDLQCRKCKKVHKIELEGILDFFA